MANAFVQLEQYSHVEPALKRLVLLVPSNPEVWYDLAGAQAVLGKATEAVKSLAVSLQLSGRRLITDPKASNLLVRAAVDGRFQSIRALPEFQKLVGTGMPENPK